MWAKKKVQVQSKNDFRPSLRNRLRSARHTLRKSGVTKKKSVHIAKNRFARPAAAAENPVRQRPGEAKILCPPVRGGVRKSFLRLRPALYVDIDCDFYGATLTALRFLFRHGLIVPGTLLGYDDWWTTACAVHRGAVDVRRQPRQPTRARLTPLYGFMYRATIHRRPPSTRQPSARMAADASHLVSCHVCRARAVRVGTADARL